MNRQQRRADLKHKDQRIVLKSIHLTFEDDTTAELDISKVMIIDRETKAQLFSEVIEPKE